MIVVSDTSALSNLALVNHLWLLENIYQTVIIPDVVASELEKLNFVVAVSKHLTIESERGDRPLTQRLELGWAIALHQLFRIAFPLHSALKIVEEASDLESTFTRLKPYEMACCART